MTRNSPNFDTFRTIDSPYGELILTLKNNVITGLFTNNNPHQTDPRTLEESHREQNQHIAQDAVDQLHEYFQGERSIFDFSTPLSYEGTPFQKAVREQVEKIEFGQMRSYGQIADALNKPLASRAVGSAIGKNPISIFIPCHRVVGSDNGLSGYAGGLDMKLRLLHHEDVKTDNSKPVTTTKVFTLT